MPISAVFLYFILTFIVLVYLILAQYTRFFQYPLFNMKLSLNLHFYMVILYSFCFLFCILLSILEWHVACVSELLNPFVNQVAYEIVQAEKLQNGIDSSRSPSVSLQQSSLGISVPVPEATGSTNSSVPSQQSPPHINTPAEVKPGSAFPRNFFVSILSDYTFSQMESVDVSDPVLSKAKSHVLQGLKPGYINPLAEGPYTPAQLNIPDLNNTKASVPLSSHEVEINGQIKKAHCFNAPAMLTALNDIKELGGGASERHGFQQTFRNWGLQAQGLTQTTCIVTDTEISYSLSRLKIPVSSDPEFYIVPPSPTNNFHTTPGAN